MPVTNKQFEALMAFAEGRLSVDEEISFLEDAAGNEELNKMLELMMINEQLREARKTHQTEELSMPGFESADVHIASVKSALEKKPASDTPEPAVVVPLARRRPSWIAAAAAAVCILVIGAAVFTYWQKHDPPLARVDPPRNAHLVAVDTAQHRPGKEILPTNEDKLARVVEPYARNRYRGDNDPVEVRQYLQYYTTGHYDQVIQARENDLEVMGGSDLEMPKEYLRFYKGLSYFEKGDDKKAVEQYRDILSRAPATPQLYPAVRWQLALALLRQGNLTDGRTLLNELAAGRTSSKYRDLAKQLLRSL